jgi:hypothetical protein
MSRLELPLIHRKLQTTGDEVVHAELTLELKSNQGTWEAMTFRVDTGTEVTTMSASDAIRRNLPIPKRPVRGLALQGQEVRAGLLRARVVGMDQTEYTFPCYFVGDPDVPLPNAKNLLGLTGVINQVRIIFDGATPPGAPHGVLVVEKR